MGDVAQAPVVLDSDPFHTVPPATLQRIIVTTGGSRNDLRKLDSSRVFALIRKPFDIHELLTKIGECSSRATLVR